METFETYRRSLFALAYRMLGSAMDAEDLVAEIAPMLEKSEAACRRSFSRAKQHLIEGRPRFQPAPDQHRRLLTSFQQAVERGDMTTLTHLLAENVILWTDGGGGTHESGIETDSATERPGRTQGSQRSTRSDRPR